jgi:hypothetical protein
MSFIDDIIDFGSTAINWFTGNTTGAALARTAVTGLALNQITQSINRENASQETSQTKTPDPGVRLQVDPDTANSIPVVYGKAVIGGSVTDAVITNSNQTMFFCLTISERTGIKLSDSTQSEITFKDIYWNNERLIFNSDGITVSQTVDLTNTVSTAAAGKIKVYCFNAGSNNPVVPYNYTNNSLLPAYSVFPNWTANHIMTNLVFVIIRMDYDATNNVTGLGDWRFVLENSMYLPGDCLYDYMTDTKYGAGIDPAEISSV